MSKAFIKVNIVKEFLGTDEVKVVTESGREVYVPSSDMIPAEPLTFDHNPRNLDLAPLGGSVTINGAFYTATEVRLYLELYESLLRQYEDLKEAYGKTTEEIQEYRKLGNVEEVRKGVEKDKDKKVVIGQWEPCKCPTCGKELSESVGDGYYKHYYTLKRCPKCGQKLNWGGE